MLILTRRMGESLLIGETACLTVRDRRGGLVLVSALVKADVAVEIDAAAAEPAGVLHGLHWHLHWLQCGEPLRIGEAVLRVGETGKREDNRRGGQRQVRISIEATRTLTVIRADDLRMALGGLGGTPDDTALERDVA